MSVSLVMPVYNEEEIIEKVIDDFYSEIISKIDDSEFIIVNDCSRDKTPEILRELEKKYLKLKVIKTPVNSGHGKAIRLGFEKAQKDWVFHSDSDYQNNPRDFWKLYNQKDKYDYLVGVRWKRADPLMRLVIFWFLRILCLLFFGVNIKDANSPFKLIKKEVLNDILKGINKDVFAPSILMIILASKKGYRIKEIPVSHMSRKTGKSSLAQLKIVKACKKSLLDLLSFKKSLSEIK